MLMRVSTKENPNPQNLLIQTWNWKPPRKSFPFALWDSPNMWIMQSSSSFQPSSSLCQGNIQMCKTFIHREKLKRHFRPGKGALKGTEKDSTFGHHLYSLCECYNYKTRQLFFLITRQIHAYQHGSTR